MSNYLLESELFFFNAVLSKEDLYVHVEIKMRIEKHILQKIEKLLTIVIVSL